MSEKDQNLGLFVGAIGRRDLAEVKVLLDSGHVSVNELHEGKLPLVEAVRAGTEFIQALLHSGANPNAHDKRNSSPLVTAAASGNLSALKTLLGSGADPNYMPTDVTCALRAAVQRRSQRNLDALEALIAAGADVNVQFRSSSGSG